jgi:hypothetical protein
MSKGSPRFAVTLRRRLAERAAGEEGAVAVLAALLIVVLLAAVAFTIDLSRLYHERQSVQNAMDFGALAGAHELPASDGATADLAADVALRVAVDNHTVLDPRSVGVNFRCVVGDRDGDGRADTVDIGAACGRRGDTNWMTGWTVKRGKAWHACNPYGGDLCNTIVLSASRTIPFFFAPVIGVDTGSTGSVSAAACRGSCGAVGSPLDVVMVVDRSTSMTVGDMANLKNAAKSVLEFYDPEAQHVGLVGLPYGSCDATPIQTYPKPDNSWWLVSLSSDYNTDGVLNNGSPLVSTINCLKRATAITRITPPGGHTDLGDPMASAMNMLQTGRADVPDVIIFMTDGEANQPALNQPCSYAATRAATAKSQQVSIFTIGYGVAAARCSYDTLGSYRGAFASRLLADMATDSNDDVPGGCGVNENKDLDQYFCESGSSDLEPAFRRAAAQALGTSRLLDF